MALVKKSTTAKQLPIPQYCEYLDKIYLFPEEIDKFGELADKKKRPFQLELEDIVLDKKNQEILVIRYALNKMEDNLCPFYDRKTKQCGIKEQQPISCRPLPVTFENVDADTTHIFVLSPDKSKKHWDMDEIDEKYPDQYDLLREYFARLEDGMNFVNELSNKKEIEIDQNVTFERFEEILSKCHPVGLIPERPEAPVPEELPGQDQGDEDSESEDEE